MAGARSEVMTVIVHEDKKCLTGSSVNGLCKGPAIDAGLYGRVGGGIAETHGSRGARTGQVVIIITPDDIAGSERVAGSIGDVEHGKVVIVERVYRNDREGKFAGASDGHLHPHGIGLRGVRTRRRFKVEPRTCSLITIGVVEFAAAQRDSVAGRLFRLVAWQQLLGNAGYRPQHKSCYNHPQ